MLPDNQPKETSKLFYGQEEVVEVTNGFKDGIKRIKTTEFADDYPAWEVEVSLSTQPRSLSEVRNSRANHIVQKMLEMFKELDVLIEDVPDIVRKLVNSMQENEHIAWLRCVGKDDKNLIRLSDWEKILSKPKNAWELLKEQGNEQKQGN